MNSEEKFSELMTLAWEKIGRTNHHLGVSLCATPITPSKPVIMGINWGGGSLSDKYSYAYQATMPAKEDFKMADYPFLTRSASLLKTIFGLDIEREDFNYTNLCLFRSPDISTLTADDFHACTSILREYADYIRPPYILSLGITNKRYLQEGNPAFKPVTLDGRGQKGWRGWVWGYEFYCVPHPLARNLNDTQRYEIWESVFHG
jgi:uracil-DNA glycosylase family 4